MPVGRNRKSKLQMGSFPVTMRPHHTTASDEEGNTSECSRPASSSVYSTLESKPDNANFYNTHTQNVISNQPASDEHSNNDLNCLDLTKLELIHEKDSSHD